MPTSGDKITYFQDFFTFALSRVPKATYSTVSATDTNSDYVIGGDGTGNPMSCTAGDGANYATYYDFHVARLAELAMSSVLFALASTALKSIMNLANTPDNLANITSISAVIGKIEDDLSPPIDDTIDSNTDTGNLSSPENIYLTIKTLSSKNLTYSQQIATLQDAIDQRRTNLQTALNAEMQLDSIAWWAAFMMWAWIVIMVVVLIVVMLALATEQYTIIYIALAVIVTIQIFSAIMTYVGYNGSLFDVTGISDSISLSLGLPSLNL